MTPVLRYLLGGIVARRLVTAAVAIGLSAQLPRPTSDLLLAQTSSTTQTSAAPPTTTLGPGKSLDRNLAGKETSL